MSTHRQTRNRPRHTGNARTLAVRHGDDLRRKSLRTPATRCFHGKRRYFTQADAELVLGSLRTSLDPRRREVRSYLCPACHGWHLTSKTPEQYAAARPAGRAPITLAVPETRGPVPTPAELVARLAARPAPTAPAPTERPVTILTRLRRRLFRLLGR